MAELGYERPGDNGETEPKEKSIVYRRLSQMFNPATGKIEIPSGMPSRGIDVEQLTKMFLSTGKPCIEGAFMTKYDGRYYLQYACPGTECI